VAQSIESIVEQGILDGTFPGAVVMVEKSGRPMLRLVRGNRQLRPIREAMTADTLFDLASLTKPLATALLVLHTCSREGIRLDSPLGRFLPEACPETGALPLLELLLHTGGLPAVPDLYKEFPNARDVDRVKAEHLLLSRRPESPRDTQVLYSCTGYQLLGLFLRRVTGQGLADLYQTVVTGPCGLRDLLFKPHPALWGRTAPTEYCPWRNRWIRGEVHDENCFCLGGDAGNAGLFGTAEAVVRLLSLFAGDGVLAGVRLLDDAHLRLMRTCGTQGLNLRRAVGFMMHDAEAPVGPRYSADSFGHTGFTGTSVWVEPRKDLTIVVLTNRVHLGREETDAGLKDFRLRLHETILRELG
jgi:CubicO group peptidase (beta-lactamase class C family)